MTQCRLIEETFPLEKVFKDCKHEQPTIAYWPPILSTPHLLYTEASFDVMALQRLAEKAGELFTLAPQMTYTFRVSLAAGNSVAPRSVRNNPHP